MKVMRSLTFATLRETRYDDEQGCLRMNDEGCPNDPFLNLPNMAGLEGVCETLGQVLDHPEFLGFSVTVSQPLLDLVCAARNRLAVKVDEKLNLEDQGDLISSIVGYRC